jgi:uncharacterized membrane protein YoaK (UPF0700 family)
MTDSPADPEYDAGAAPATGGAPVPESAVATKTGDTARDPVTLLASLIVLTLVSGLVDAVSYLGLGHVFTANMTGNVVVLGFAAAGAAGFSVSTTLTSLGVFLVGAVLAGHAARRIRDRGRLLITTMVLETVLIGAAALITFLSGTAAAGWARYTVIAILALAMGMRNAAVRRIGVQDISTTVLTSTLTGLASDSVLAGGEGPRSGRRIGAVVAMLAGAAAGAVLLLHVNAALPLLAGAALTGATAVVYAARGAPVRPEMISA